MPNLRFFAKFGMNSFVNNDMQNPSLRELFERIHPSLRDYLYLCCSFKRYSSKRARYDRRGMESSSLSGTSEWIIRVLNFRLWFKKFNEQCKKIKWGDSGLPRNNYICIAMYKQIISEQRYTINVCWIRGENVKEY